MNSQNSATSPPPAAQNAAQTSPSPDSRQAAINKLKCSFQAELKELQINVNGLFAFEDATEQTIYALTQMLEAWILSEYKHEVKTAHSDADIEFHDRQVRCVFQVIQLIASLSERYANLHEIADKLKEGGVEAWD